MSTQESDVNFSFSGILFGWLVLTLFIGSFIYSFIAEILPFSEPNLSNQQVLLLRVIWVLWIPFITFFFFLALLPFGTIDFSLKAMFQTIAHKVLFLCTSPIILVGYFIAQGFVNGSQEIAQSGLGFIFYWLFTWPFVILWCVISLLLWELFAGKNASKTIKRFRTRHKIVTTTSYGMSYDAIFQDIVNHNYTSSQLNQSPLSRRWLAVCISLPIFSVYMGSILDPTSTKFMQYFRRSSPIPFKRD